MTDQNLTNLLERAADRTQVGPPPLDDMLARGRHVRRRRTVLLSAAASAAVVGVVGGTAVLSGLSSAPQRGPTAADTSVSPSVTTGSSPTALDGIWAVQALVGPDGQSKLEGPLADKVEMTFKDGEVSATTGCNEVFGTYDQSGDQGQDLVFPRAQLGSTLVACSDEPPLVPRLLDVRHVSGSDDVRYLHADDWLIVAELRRR